MTTKQTFLDLAARCESAETGSRECRLCGLAFKRTYESDRQWAKKAFCSSVCGGRFANNAKAMSKMAALDKLFATSEITENGCVVSTTRKPDRSGYIVAKSSGETIKAHRLAYMVECGPIPEGMVVMHSCDNRKCFNPKHLSIGTPIENTADRNKKGRAAALSFPFGELPRSRLFV